MSFKPIFYQSLLIQINHNTPKINIQYFLEPDHILLMVEDNGIGIDKDYEIKIFLLFQQLEKNKGCEGTGIGLTICKSIVENTTVRFGLNLVY